jgi:hypothetical protein
MRGESTTPPCASSRAYDAGRSSSERCGRLQQRR